MESTNRFLFAIHSNQVRWSKCLQLPVELSLLSTLSLNCKFVILLLFWISAQLANRWLSCFDLDDRSIRSFFFMCKANPNTVDTCNWFAYHLCLVRSDSHFLLIGFLTSTRRLFRPWGGSVRLACRILCRGAVWADILQLFMAIDWWPRQKLSQRMVSISVSTYTLQFSESRFSKFVFLFVL